MLDLCWICESMFPAPKVLCRAVNHGLAAGLSTDPELVSIGASFLFLRLLKVPLTNMSMFQLGFKEACKIS